MTDECRLTQIMLNLGSNAVQYTASINEAVGVVGRIENGENTSLPHQKMNIDLELEYLTDIQSINMRISDTGAILLSTSPAHCCIA